MFSALFRSKDTPMVLAAQITLLPDQTGHLADVLRDAYDRAQGDDSVRRAALVARVREVLQEGHRTARFRLEESGWDGIKTATALSCLMDEILQALFEVAVTRIYPMDNPSYGERLSLVAVGGYGRALLAPGSDIDLLFLLPYKQTSWGESVAEFILYTLWDMGLKVGHATRSVDQCIRSSKADMTIRTSLLEARYIAGAEALYRLLRRRFAQDIVAQGSPEDFVDAKLKERDDRHIRSGESRYLVEPNIKDGKGGMRDLQSLFWIAKYVYRVDDAAELVTHGLFTPEEFAKFADAERFLWTVRCHLHFLTGRPEERLSFDVQREMASRLGYNDRAGLSSVERFMKHYFLIAKDVGDLTHIFCSALEDANKKRRPVIARVMPNFGRRREIGAFAAEGGRLDIANPDAFSKDPCNLIRIFHIADREELEIAPNALRVMRQSLALIDDTLRNDKEANRLFTEILSSRNNPERALREMNEAGVLGPFIPDFGRIVAMMQFNMYHHYTVDEHLIRAIGFLSKIEHGVFAKENPLSSEMFSHIKHRKPLYVAMLLHDIAKGRPEDHSEAGREVARNLCPRLGLSASETELVAWLVEHHLLMSDVAQRRDIADPKTVSDFTRVVQSPERLRLLLILTVADIRAVGPGVWNSWKGALLRELYYEAEAVLQGGHSGVTRIERVEQAKSDLTERLKSLPRDQVERILSLHYPPYWLSLDSAAHEAHAHMILEADAAQRPLTFTAKALPASGASEITVYTPDHAGLFSRLAGVFALSGATIADARIFTTTHGMALDIFTIQDADSEAFDDPDRLQRLQNAIEASLKGDLKAHELVQSKRLRPRERAFTVEPTVVIDNSASEMYTVIEVNGRDRPGLLHDLTRVLFSLSLSVASARIATYGERAVDVFYVKDNFGLKVLNTGRLVLIEARLLEALEDTQ